MDCENYRKVVKIQKVIRGHLGRKKFQRHKVLVSNENYKMRYISHEKVLSSNIVDNGAAFIIQKWIKKNSYLRKNKWKMKYKKMVESLISRKKIHKAILKSKGYKPRKFDEIFRDKDLTLLSISIVISRIIRGFLSRQRYKKYKSISRSRAILIQRAVRGYLVRIKYPDLSAKFKSRSLRLKKWKKKQDLISSLKKSKDYIHSLEFYCQFRRASFIFNNIKLGDISYLDNLDNFIYKIQFCWKRYKFSLRCFKRQEAKKISFLVKIQRWFHTLYWRKTVLTSLKLIQPFWKFKALKLIRRHRASTKIKTTYLTYSRRKWYLGLIKVRNNNAKVIQHWSRSLSVEKGYRFKLHRKRYVHEVIKSGENDFSFIELKWFAHFLWQGAKKLKPDSPHELQRIFLANSINGGIEATRVIKLFRECKGFLTNGISVNTIEINFAKVKSTSEKRLDYKQFLELVLNMSITKYLNVDPSKVTERSIIAKSKKPIHGKSSPVHSSVKLMGSAPQPDDEFTTESKSAEMTNKVDIDDFQFAGLCGRAALVSKFMVEFLSTTYEYKRNIEYLDKKAAFHVSRLLIKDKLQILQTFAKNRLFINRVTSDLKKLKQKKLFVIYSAAAKKIQSLIRSFLGKRLINRLAQSNYLKYIDGESEREYWFNPKTKSAFWSKPPLLGKYDCGMAVRMPRSDELYSINCAECRSVTATCFCDLCRSPFCTICFALNHQEPTKKKSHTPVLIDNCIQCEFQVGTRYCNSCKDLFCDSCYRHLHKKGRLRYHVFERTTETCEFCEEYSAHWVEKVKNESNSIEIDRFWCTTCFIRENGINPREINRSTLENRTEPIFFFGKSVKLHLEKLANEKKSREIQEAFELRKKELRRQKLNKCALDIQRIYRGHAKRIEIMEFIQMRREFLQLREQEQHKRKTCAYSILSYFGAAPSLGSDTTLERVKKLYPGYMHSILEECFQGNWTEACRLLVEHEEFMSTRSKSNMFQRIYARYSLHQTTLSYEKLESKFQIIEENYESILSKFKNARESGALSETRMKVIKASLKQAESKKKAFQKRLKEKEKKLNIKEQRLTDLEGPRGLQKLVEDRRKYGILLPFRLSLRRLSRLALVGWEVEFDPEDEDGLEKYDFKSGRWKEKLQIGDKIIIKGAIYTICPPMIAKKRPGSSAKLKRPKSSSSIKSSENSEVGDSEDNSRSESRSQGQADNSSSKYSSETSGDHSNFNDLFNLETEIIEQASDDHIQLDRPWLLDDVYNIEVYKVVPMVFYQKPFSICKRMVQNSYPSQKLIAISAITLHKWSHFLERSATMFDEESSMYSWLREKAGKAKDSRDRYLQISRTIVQMSFDFTLRRRVYKILRSFYKIGSTVFKLIRGLVKVVTGEAKESPFEYWQRSLHKEDIVCEFDFGNDRVKKLGEFKIDLNAPLSIMREVLKRAFRSELNEIVGESFLFFRVNQENNKDEIMLRENEFRTFSKDYCFMKTDPNTMISLMTVNLVKDETRGKLTIPEYKEENESDKDSEEEAISKKFQ